MPFLTTLLVEHDPMIAWKISQAIEARGITRPRHVSTGREAIELATRNEFDLCLVDYDLPDMDAINLTVQLRQRKGDLSIIMLSNAGSESVAIAAFRAGVSDYLPKDNQLYAAIARAAQNISESRPLRAATTGIDIPDGMPSELLNPTYQNRLRVIGRHIDMNRARMVSIFEVDGGFLVRSLSEHGRKAAALEFPDRDFLHWITEAYRNRGKGERGASTSALLPSGYEDFLRAIGAALDQHQAEAITIAEFASVIVVGGNAPLANDSQIKVGNLQWILQKDDILLILDEGYRRRQAEIKPRPKNSVVDRILGRQASFQTVTA